MAWLGDVFKVDPVTGIAVGLGAPLLAPVAGQVLRPTAKAAIKGGLIAYQGLAELGARAREMVAEAQTELAAQPSPENTQTTEPGTGDRGPGSHPN
jgi:hypothetical protein